MERNDRIVFINQNAGYLMTDIINIFKERYCHSILITGNLVRRNIELDDYCMIDNIIKYSKSNSTKRLLTWIIGAIQIYLKLIFKYRKSDLFITTNPPFVTLLPIFHKKNYNLLIFDIYPDVLISHDVIGKESFLSRWWRKKNLKFFSNAKCIFTLSEGMADCISVYSKKDNIKIVPLWIDTMFLKPVDRSENIFIKNHSLENKFIVLYSGNIGSTHDVEVIVDIADKFKQDKDIIFLFIGEGSKKEMIIHRVKDLSLNNCLFLPFQDKDILPYSLSSADIGIVTLDSKTSSYSVPSKTVGLMAVGAPLLCIAEKNSELRRITEKYKCGKTFEKKAVNDMTVFIQNIKSDENLKKTYALNSRKASEFFSSKNAYLFLD